jgi:hypothetical protein
MKAIAMILTIAMSAMLMADAAQAFNANRSGGLADYSRGMKGGTKKPPPPKAAVKKPTSTNAK